jgi:hypothetical protein
MQYLSAFGFFINGKGGFLNLLLLTLCQFIPIVGPIVIMGYCAEVSVALNDDPDFRDHPRFTFDRFVEYLSRGVWPFLMRLTLVACLCLVIGAIVGIFVLTQPPQGNPPVALLVVLPVVGLGMMILVAALTIPMSFHSELTGKYDLPGAYRFAWSFWSLMFVDAIVTSIVYSFFASFLSIVGFLCCFIGIYPMSTLLSLASRHLMVQLYRHYLDSGGQPLEEKRLRKRDYDEDDEPLDD